MNLKIRAYEPADRNACPEIFKSNMPKYFAAHELQEFEEWLDGQDNTKLAYKNTEAEYYYIAELDAKTISCGGFYLYKNDKYANMVWGMVDMLYAKKDSARSSWNTASVKLKKQILMQVYHLIQHSIHINFLKNQDLQ